MTAVPSAVVRLGWVTWRQHRRNLTAVLGLFAAADLVLLITGIMIHSEPLAARPRIWTTALAQVAGGTDYGYLTILAVLPLVVGACAGAPVILSELESGTARFAWTQGYGRIRLVVAKLAIIAAMLAGGAASLGLIFQWWFAPYARLRFGEPAFSSYPPALIGWTLGAFALAVLLGLVYRSVPGAVGATILVTFAADFLLNHKPSDQPAGRFWPFQFIEAGLVLAAAVVFAAVAVLFVRRPRIARLAPAVAPDDGLVAPQVPAAGRARPARLGASGPASRGPVTGKRRLAMAWITWRQHRLGLLIMAALAAVIALFQVKSWTTVSRGYDLVTTPGCRAQPVSCLDGWVRVGSYPQVGLALLLLALAGLIALEFGPTIGREFEWGTDRLVWTQGAGRARWTAGRMVALTSFILAIALPVALLAGLSIGPFERAGFVSRWTFSEFVTSAPVYLSLIACALALAMLLGVAIRRTLGAMGAILGGVVLFAVTLPALYGPLLSISAKVGPGSPLDPQNLAGIPRPQPDTAGIGPPGSWVTHGWYVSRSSARLSQFAAARVTARLQAFGADGPRVSTWLKAHHLRYLVSYQPADRFWLFQCLAAACLLAVAALAWAATLRLVKSSSR